MNKKLIGSLLGGAIVAIASFGGLKLNDTISQNKKINYYKNLSKKFDKEQALGKEWYLPNWEDNAIWNKQHNRYLNFAGWDEKQKGDFKKKYPTPESFRDFCFEKVETEMSSCRGSNDWCMDCVREKQWDKK